LHENAFRGEVPGTIVNLTGLTTTDVGYNMLMASNPDVRGFLDSKDPDWAETQTVPPSNLQAELLPDTSVRLNWTPILYSGHGGYYEISYATSPEGPYTVHGYTSSKASNSYVAANLPPHSRYFAVRTYTPAHGSQKNDLWSDYARTGAGSDLVNKHLLLAQMKTSYQPADPRAVAGVFTISARFTNVSNTTITNLWFKVKSLTGNHLLLNAEGGAGGVGATISVPVSALGANGTLDPGESFTQVFEIGLTKREAFTFVVDSYGMVMGRARDSAESDTADFRFEISEEEFQTQVEQQWIYLPVLSR
jgi:hypothetical protein